MTAAKKYRMRLVRAHMDYITAEINDVDKMIENFMRSAAKLSVIFITYCIGFVNNFLFFNLDVFLI